MTGITAKVLSDDAFELKHQLYELRDNLFRGARDWKSSAHPATDGCAGALALVCRHMAHANRIELVEDSQPD